MVVHARNDSILCRIASDCFYSLPPRSIHDFEDLTKFFLSLSTLPPGVQVEQPSSLLRQVEISDSLKAYIGYFQNQLVKIHNCSEDASALVFINGLQVTYPLYKHLMKYNVTCWSEVLSVF